MKYVFFNGINGVAKSFLIFSDYVQHLQFKLTIGSDLITPCAGFANFKNGKMEVFGESVSLRKGTRERVQNFIKEANDFYYLEFKTDFCSVPKYVIFPDYMDFDIIKNTLEEKLNSETVSSGLLTPYVVNDYKTVLVDEKLNNNTYFDLDNCIFDDIEVL
tara:strand:- start:12158 stop:12637 length:480 start_codon:yes stop_codon:yes gene_type:complete